MRIASQAEDQEEGRDPHASPEAFDTLKSFRQVCRRLPCAHGVVPGAWRLFVFVDTPVLVLLSKMSVL